MNQLFAFRQAEYKDDYQDYASGGVCATLVAFWLGLMGKEKAQGVDHRKNEIVNAIQDNASLLQKVYADHYEGDDEESNKFHLLKLADAGIKDTKDWAGLPIHDELIDYIKDKRRTGFRFGFKFTTRTGRRAGHAIGLFRSGQSTWHPSGHVYMFDPNYGEYKGDKGDFTGWFTNFMLTNYGRRCFWSYVQELGDPKKAPHAKAVKVM